jgi:hypothetical protein
MRRRQLPPPLCHRRLAVAVAPHCTRSKGRAAEGSRKMNDPSKTSNSSVPTPSAQQTGSGSNSRVHAAHTCRVDGRLGRQARCLQRALHRGAMHAAHQRRKQGAATQEGGRSSNEVIQQKGIRWRLAKRARSCAAHWPARAAGRHPSPSRSPPRPISQVRPPPDSRIGQAASPLGGSHSARQDARALRHAALPHAEHKLLCQRRWQQVRRPHKHTQRRARRVCQQSREGRAACDAYSGQVVFRA